MGVRGFWEIARPCGFVVGGVPNGDIWGGLPGGPKEAAPSRTTLRRADVGGRGPRNKWGWGYRLKRRPIFALAAKWRFGYKATRPNTSQKGQSGAYLYLRVRREGNRRENLKC